MTALAGGVRLTRPIAVAASAVPDAGLASPLPHLWGNPVGRACGSPGEPSLAQHVGMHQAPEPADVQAVARAGSGALEGGRCIRRGSIR